MSDSRVAYIPPPPQPPSKESGIKDLDHYDVKSEEIRRRTFNNWPVEFLDKNYLAAAGFYFTGFKDIVCCAFCEVQLKEWEPEDCPFKEHKRWSPACPFINKLNVGYKPVASNNEELNRSRDVCGSPTGKHLCLYLFRHMCMFYIFLSAIFSMCFTVAEPSEQNPNKSRGPVFPEYNRVETRLKTFEQYPVPVELLAEAGFFNSG